MEEGTVREGGAGGRETAVNSGGISWPFSERILRSSFPVDLALVAVKKV
jgi:hypothetical protein